MPNESTETQAKGELEIAGSYLVKFLVYLLVFLTPIIVTSVFMSLTLNQPLLNPVPVWNDELVYWHGVLTFREVGFAGGFYTFDELASRATFTHFDAHGPWYFAFMGVLSSISDWTPGNAVIFNLVFIAIATAVYLFVVRPNSNQAFLVALIIGTCWAIPLYIPIAMMESLNQAISIIFSALLFHSLRHKSSLPLLIKIEIICFIVLVSLMRPTWAFFLFPLFFCWTLNNSLKTKFIYIFASLILMAIIFIFFNWGAAPYLGNFNSHFLSLIATNPLLALGTLLSKYKDSLYLMGRGTIVEITVRQEAFLIIFITVSAFIQHYLKTKPNNFWTFGIQKHESVIHLLTIGLITLFLFSLHDIFDWRDYRIFAPVLLCAALFLVAEKHYTIALLLIGINLMTFSSALATFQDFHKDRYTISIHEIIDFKSRSSRYISYNPETKNAWCNTLLTHATRGYTFPPLVQTLPAGVGFSIILDTNRIDSPMKSKYLLVDDAHFAKLQAKSNLSKLDQFGKLGLYLNMDVKCN